jgi:ABC-2 type transport system ATP-binding protein
VSRREFWEILQQIHTGGVTIVVTTPYMDEAEQCSRIGLMFKGKLIAVDTPRNMKKTFKATVLEARPQDAAAFKEFIKNTPGISDWQQLGDRFHIVLNDAATADDFIQKAGAGIRRIAASVEDVFVERIKT